MFDFVQPYGIGIAVRVARVKTVYVGQQHQEVCLYHRRHLRTQCVVVADFQFLNRNRIVFIDDGDGAALQQHGKCAAGILVAAFVGKVGAAEQDLRGHDAV